MENDKFKCMFCSGPVNNGVTKDKEGTASICEKCLIDSVQSMILTMKESGLTPLQVFSIVQDIKYEDVEATASTLFTTTKDYQLEGTFIPIKPMDIKLKLDEYVINQDAAKRVLSVAAYNHYKRLGALGKIEDGVVLEKSNVLLLGPTGTGKTLLVKTLSKILDVPFAIADATSLTENGYVGDDVESVVEKLYLAANKNIKRAEKGIIYIDEIDKLAADFESSRKDVGGAGVQQALLKIIEGHKIHFVPGADKKNPMAPMIEIDTSNILFIVGGAFASIDYDNISSEAIKDYGIIPELLGRLPIITQTEPLNKHAMLKILTEPKNSLVRQYQAMFKIENIELEFTAAALSAIADEGLSINTGARGLRGVVEKIMLDLAFEAPSIEGLSRAIIDYENGSVKRKFIKNKQEAVV
jgi:ATP-dependent Clp protease ATP-binding subunit ClpX